MGVEGGGHLWEVLVGVGTYFGGGCLSEEGYLFEKTQYFHNTQY